MAPTIVGSPRPPWWRPFARRRWDREMDRELDDDGVRALIPEINRVVAEEFARGGIVVAGEADGDVFVADGRSHPRIGMLELTGATARELFNLARVLAVDVCSRGPGWVRVLPLVGAVFPVYRARGDGTCVLLSDNGDDPIVPLRSAVYHERVSTPLYPDKAGA
jgi:hypothetical protein